METNKILSADVLDLLFEGRNKEYGAYDLRKHYNNRLGRAMAGTMGVVVALFCFGFVSGRGHVKAPLEVTDTINLTAISKEIVPPTPPPPVVKTPPVATRIFTAPKLVEQDVPEDEKPPVNTDLDNVKIGNVNAAGSADQGLDAPTPASDGGKGVVEVPKKEDDGAFIPIEKEAEFPGGVGAWLRFLGKNLRYPDEAINAELQGVVQVRFIVDKDGNVSDVEAISGPTEGGLREEAVRVIKKSGKWTPALQNGRYVKTYKVQPVTFVVGQ